MMMMDDEPSVALRNPWTEPHHPSPAVSALHWFGQAALTRWHKGCESLAGRAPELCGEQMGFTSTARVLPSS